MLMLISTLRPGNLQGQGAEFAETILLGGKTRVSKILSSSVRLRTPVKVALVIFLTINLVPTHFVRALGIRQPSNY